MWTVPIPPDSVQIDPANGTGSIHVVDLPMPDYGKIPNGLTHGKSTPSVVSFDIAWHGVTGRSRAYDPTNGFAAEMLSTGATMSWSAKQDGFAFVSDPPSTSKVTEFASIGHERNGIYAGAASTEWPPLAVNGRSKTDGKSVTFTYNLANLSASAIGGLELRARIPDGSAVVDSWFSQPGTNRGTNNGFDVTWAAPVSSIAGGATVGPFSITVTIPTGKSAAQVQSLGWTRFLAPVAGDSVSGWIAGG